MTIPGKQPDPHDVLRDGRFDPAALLILWLGRKLFLPALLAGVIGAVQVTQDFAPLGEEIARRLERGDVPAEFYADLTWPVWLVFVALVLRAVVEIMAWALAYPLTRLTRPSDYPRGGMLGRYMRLWSDRVHLSGSYRSLRWSWVVRQEAADRLGPVGRVLEATSSAMSWASGLLLLALIAVIAAPS